jgi:cyclopropane fatty-acyl-phospholipid synthase-like methyltransferase
MALMYKSNKEMFDDFLLDQAAAEKKISSHYDMDIEFVSQYINHLLSSQRENENAYRGFESEMGAFQATLERVNDLGLSLTGSNILDIGCSSGHAMRAALKLGAKNAVGIEYSAARANNGNRMLEKYGYPPSIKVGSALDLNVTADIPADFDFVFIFDVLEHVPSIDGVISMARTKLKKGGKMVIKSGNPYNPQFMLSEPHYGLPGMTLLDRKTAAEYFSYSHAGDYDDVFFWLTKPEVELILKKYGFKIISQKDATDFTLKEFDEAINLLESYTVYPSENIRQQVVNAIKFLKLMRMTSIDQEQIFCVMNFQLVAELS